MVYPFESPTRELKSLDGVWKLRFSPDARNGKNTAPGRAPRGAVEVAVPGSINEQVVDRKEYLTMDRVRYFKEFYVPASWSGKRLFLRFGSVTRRAVVYLNGMKLGMHEGGHLPFEFEITKKGKPGRANLLVVDVDNVLNETTVPQGNIDPKVGGVASWRPGNLPNVHYDFFPFMGIDRPVMLYTTGPARLESLHLVTRRLRRATASVHASLRVSGRADTVRISCRELGLRHEIRLSGHSREIETRFTAKNVRPWSPQSPRLYTLRFEMVRGGEVIDTYDLPFGFRTIAVKKGSVLLNGKRIFLRGFGRHEDNTIHGRGLSLPHLVKDYRLMQWIGANSFRTSHYPYSDEDMYMADRLGFMVIDEVAANTLSMLAVQNKRARAKLAKNHMQQTAELIARDINHPSVIAWSLGNECETFHRQSVSYFTGMVRFAKSLDSSRPVTFVTNTGPANERCAHVFDIICLNTYPSWYTGCGKYEDIERMLAPAVEGLWKKYRKPILISEFGADTIPGVHSEHILMWTEEYQCAMIEQIIRVAEKYPYVFGTHIWNLADFKVGQHPGRAVNNWKGVFTRERQPKMAAHEIRRLWRGTGRVVGA
ncbi:MAG: beta-glucuronidase [Chitinivibrionales bacterium]|nr:beta-glucuronidase [Chitinivibrionales bacterium]MBD3395158.1 beta-glucuronidase [Chitinivibrionales bacterium]